MSFSFNFELNEEDSHNSQQASFSITDDKSKNKDNQANSGQTASEVKSFYDDSIISKLETKTVIFNDHALDIVDTCNLETLMTFDEDFKTSLSKLTSLGDIVTHSDLVDGVYEGGLKVWECGIDLAKFLSSHSLGSPIKIAEKNVLELGCGAGLPGLYCVKCGAKCVDFQDYNVEVLKLLTHPNVELNTDADDSQSQTNCRYFAGDWEEFCDLDVNHTKYDLILSAETIYNVENYPKLHKVFDQMLAADGVILIAAKVYYFGVGGSVDAFLEYVNGRGCFDSETVWETQSGVPRKILMLKRQIKNTKQPSS